MLPKVILLPIGSNKNLLSDLLPEVKIIIPQRGLKRKLVEMASENALFFLHERLKMMEKDTEKTIQAIEEIGNGLGIGLPRRIESFDNSNTQGINPVSVLVVFLDGKPEKKEYRKFKIRGVDKPNDFETMKEVIRRRYTRVLKESLPLPDLILVDGGKNQITAARDVLENELGLYIPIAGMVKDDKHKTSRMIGGNPPKNVNIIRGSQGFYLMQRIQEEVHRFAISFHRQTRDRSMLQSKLDSIPGVGRKRKEKLYRHFGFIDKMKNSSIEEYRKAGIGDKLAKVILEKLNQDG